MDFLSLMIWVVISIPCTICGSTSTTTKQDTTTSLLASSSTIPPQTSSGKISTPVVISLTSSPTTAANNTGNSTAGNASTSPGKSWNFLAGVVGVVLATSFFILMAIKFPKWYNYLASYNHHRLQEYQPDMFDQEFTSDMSTAPQTTPSMLDEDDCMVVFEQKNIFVTDDDGFIEDKYIDAQELTEES
ncbi:leucine-rich repeat-containing protein 19 [Pleurodeles waltl]|uniref:leucine-rich repeat-containing protein 19 n=1 Tax=Pleurodeles waltl TaxID=8319 RepID=UPI003709802B